MSSRSAMSVAVVLISAAFFIICCQCQGDETGGDDPMCHGHGCKPPMHEYDDYDDDEHHDDHDVPIWPIVVGVVVGVVIMIIIIVVIVVVCKRKRIRTAVNQAAAADKHGVAVVQGHQNEVGLQSSEEKKEPPPAYTGPASAPKIDSGVGVQPPPYTIQLPIHRISRPRTCTLVPLLLER